MLPYVNVAKWVEYHYLLSFHSLQYTILGRGKKLRTLEHQTAYPDVSWIAHCHVITLLTDKRDVTKVEITDRRRNLFPLQFLQNLNTMGNPFCLVEVVNTQALPIANRQTDSTTHYLESSACVTAIRKRYNVFTSFSNCLQRR